ncbi:unnamed protein product, partial [Rhizoctonia solani]
LCALALVLAHSTLLPSAFMQAMSPKTNGIPLSRASTPRMCVAPQARLCRCMTCTSSFSSTLSTISEVSTTCLPPEVDDLESAQHTETRNRPRGQPLRAFPTRATILELDDDYQDNEDSASELIDVEKHHTISQIPSRTQSLARTDSVSSVASDRTVRAPQVNALRRNESVVSNATVDDYQYEEPAEFLPPFEVRGPSTRAQCLGPTRSNYNLTPTPAIPLGRPKNRRRLL